ncbi:MAG: flagellar hook-length control protein FliK [Rhodanobacteraceae bacterium]
MIVQPTQLANLNWAAAAAGTLAKPWKVGSLVSGRVLEYLSETRLIMQISGLTIEAEPPSTGLVPRQFQARVMSNGPQPILELVTHQQGQSSPMAAAVRARLPLQDGLQPMLADLHALARTPGARALPEPVRAALARLEASIVDRHDILDPGVLRDTVKRSGLHLEHALLQQARTPERLPTAQIDYDTKAALERLTQALKRLPQAMERLPQEMERLPQEMERLPQAMQHLSQTMEPPPRITSQAASLMPENADTQPPLLRLPLQPQARPPAPLATDAFTLAGDMLKHTQAALSRIEIMQLEAHPAASPQAWMVEVPVRDDGGFDVLQLRFEQEADDGEATATPRWTLSFTLEPPRLGEIHGQIRLHGVQVNVDLWAQHDAAVQALEEQTSVLARLLEGSGLQLMQLRVRQGTPLRHTGLGHTLLEASA